MLRRILDLDPDMVDVWSQYGSALSRAGRHQEAFEAYARMIRLQPDEPNGALGAAAALLALNRLPEARAHAELAIRTAPSQAYQALALIDIAGKTTGQRPGKCRARGEGRARAANGSVRARYPRVRRRPLCRGGAAAARGATGVRAAIVAAARSLLHARRRAGAARSLPRGRTVPAAGDPSLPAARAGARGAGDALPGGGP